MQKIEFVTWRNHPITQEVYRLLGQYVEQLQSSMYSDQILSDPNGMLKLNRLKGHIDGITAVLNLEVEDEEDVEETSESPRV